MKDFISDAEFNILQQQGLVQDTPDFLTDEEMTRLESSQATVAPKSSFGEPTFKASMGGAKTIIPNIAKMAGNVPSDFAGIVKTGVFDPLEKTMQSTGLLGDIYKDRGFAQGTKDIAGGFADTATKIGEWPGKFLVGTNDRLKLQNQLSPIKEQTLKQRDTLMQHYYAAQKLGDKARMSRLAQAIKLNKENLDSLEQQGILTKEEQYHKGTTELSNLFKYPIEHPMQTGITVATLAPETQAAISSKLKPITAPIENIVPKTKQVITDSLIARQPQAINELEQTYKDIASGTTPGKKKIAKLETKTESLNRAGTEGRTPMRTLAEDGIIPNQSGTKLDTFGQAEEYRQKTIPLRKANRQALVETGLSTAPVSLDDLERSAIEYASTPQNINAGRMTSLENEITSRFNELRKRYPDGKIPLSVVDDIKSATWDNVFKNKGFIEADVLKKDSEYAIAKSLQKNIEETAIRAGNPEVAQLNREIGDRLDASKFLEDINGKTVQGGRLLKYVTTGIGSTFGHTIPGKIIGAIGGNLVGDLIISNKIATPIKRLILRNLETASPKAYTQTIQWLEKQNLDRETRLLLGPASNNSLINQGRTIPNFPRGNQEYVGPETTTGGYQSKSPAREQTMPAITNESKIPMPDIIPKPISKVNNTEIPIASDNAVVKAFNKSTDQVKVGKFEIGSFGKNTLERKVTQTDRFPINELEETQKHITGAYKASSNPSNYRKDNIAWIAKMPNGETRVIYTRKNSSGIEEIINAHKITDPKFETTLKSYGTPDQSRTGIFSLERSESNPLTYGSKDTITKSDGKVNIPGLKSMSEAIQESLNQSIVKHKEIINKITDPEVKKLFIQKLEEIEKLKASLKKNK
jgi:hypothetical protein